MFSKKAKAKSNADGLKPATLGSRQTVILIFILFRTKFMI